MKQTITRDVFMREMLNDTYSSYSREAINAIFDHIEEYEDSTGDRVEFDIPTIRGQYMEYKSFEEFHADNPEFANSGREIDVLDLPGGGFVYIKD